MSKSQKVQNAPCIPIPRTPEDIAAFKEMTKGNENSLIPIPTNPDYLQQKEQEKEEGKSVEQLNGLARKFNCLIDQCSVNKLQAMWHLGCTLLELQPSYPGEWNKHLKTLCIEETRWKRVRTLADFYKTKEELSPFHTADEALKFAGWGRKQTQKHKNVRRNKKKKEKQAAATKSVAPIQDFELLAMSNFVSAVGGWKRAIEVVKEGFKVWLQENQPDADEEFAKSLEAL